MKNQELVIGKEYYFDMSKKSKGIFAGYSEDGNKCFFNPTVNDMYLLQEEKQEFPNHVGFGKKYNFIPVEK